MASQCLSQIGLPAAAATIPFTGRTLACTQAPSSKHLQNSFTSTSNLYSSSSHLKPHSACGPF